MIPSIVLSAHTTGLGVIRALGMKGVPVISVSYGDSDMGHVSKYVRESIIAPHPEKHEKRFVQLLLECHARFGRSVLIPADDSTLMVVSRNRKMLERYFIVACPDYGVTEKVVDKKNTYALAELLGIPAPKTVLPHTPAELLAFAAVVGYPCIIKPCLSHVYYELFGFKAVKADDEAVLLDAWKKATAAGIEVMLQEYIPGDDANGVNYNSYSWDGKALVEFTAAKVRLDPPEIGVPSVVMSLTVPEVLDPGRRLLQGLGYSGYSCIEFKKDARDGVYKLMEVNGRHNRSTLLAVRCGINFPWLEYSHLVRGVEPVSCRYAEGVYWIDEYRDTHLLAQQLRKGKFRLLRYVLPYFRKHLFAVFDVDDPEPFLKRNGNLFKRFWRQLAGRPIVLRRAVFER